MTRSLFAACVILFLANVQVANGQKIRHSVSYPQRMVVVSRTPNDLTCQYVVYRNVSESIVVQEEKDGQIVQVVKEVNRLVAELRTTRLPLDKLVVKDTHGKVVDKKRLTAPLLKKQRVPILFFNSNAKLSDVDQQFFRKDLLVVCMVKK